MLTHVTQFNPKNPGPLKVLTIGRVSTAKQDIQSLDVQQAEVRKAVEGSYDGPIELISLGEQMSGDVALRTTYIEACDLIEGGQLDVVVLFDLSKAGRLPRWMHQLIDLCVDHDTRFITIGDNIDTAEPHWEIAAGAASLVHGTHNAHTRHRIKAKGDWAFNNGGQVTKTIFGYRKLSQEEADSGEHGPKGLRLAKMPECTPTIQQMAAMVLGGSTYEEVAAWLNEADVPLGPLCQRSSWTGKAVIAYLRHPLLHGERQRSRYLTTKKRTDKGSKRSINPNPLVKVYAELAHLTAVEHDKLLAEMHRRVNCHPRKRRAIVGPKGRARSRTLFPGQVMTCSFCGSVFHYRGDGSAQCSNRGDPAKGACLNHIQVNAQIVRNRFRNLLLRLAEEHPEFKVALIAKAYEEFGRLRGRENREVQRLQGQVAALEAEKRNLVTAIKSGGPIDALVDGLKQTEQALKHVTHELAQTESRHVNGPAPITPECVEVRLPEALDDLLASSYEMSAFLRQVISQFVVHPLVAVDTGKPVARACVTFDLSALLGRHQEDDNSSESACWSVTLDLFDPPAHIRCLQEAVRLHKEHADWSAERIADAISATLGEKVERWSVRHALRLYAMMEVKGVETPYVLIRNPEEVSRWRMQNRHRARWDQSK
ncbi:MAG: recombinase family protein [Planctomycetota bacterium]|nr:recombinase family protein [Planctomycetota bacterium]